MHGTIQGMMPGSCANKVTDKAQTKSALPTLLLQSNPTSVKVPDPLRRVTMMKSRRGAVSDTRVLCHTTLYKALSQGPSSKANILYTCLVSTDLDYCCQTELLLYCRCIAGSQCIRYSGSPSCVRRTGRVAAKPIQLLRQATDQFALCQVDCTDLSHCPSKT